MGTEYLSNFKIHSHCCDASKIVKFLWLIDRYVHYNETFESIDLEFNCESYELNTRATPDMGGHEQYRIFGENGQGFDRI